MNNAKLSHSDRQFFVTPVTAIEYEAVTRTVHRLQRPFFLLDVKGEHVVLVILPVTGGLPKLRVKHIRRDDLRKKSVTETWQFSDLPTFLISTLPILGLEQESEKKIRPRENQLIHTRINSISVL